MLNRTALICVLGLVGVSLAQAASAQPRWGRERLPGAGACFYEDRDFRGRYFCVRPGDRLQSLPNGMGDEISSMRLLGSTEVTVFRDRDWRGRSARFIGDVRDLKREGWNDQISSIRVGRGSGGGWFPERPPVWGNERPPREGACFYEDADFRGRYFCAPRGATYTSLPAGFNDRISSIRLFGSEVRIFQDRNFGGRSSEVRSDVRNLRGNWRDNVSSIRVF
jgi:Beta/Gamma crystallin